jgi:hypothetical protein
MSKVVRNAGKRTIVKMGKYVLPAALRISGLTNNKHSRVLGHSAVEFMASTPAQRSERANNLIGALINFHMVNPVSGGNEAQTQRLASSALKKVRVYAPEHYNALWWAALRATPRAAYKYLRA